MAQTSEDRIKRQYKALRKDPYANEYGVSWMWMRLARQWKRPVQEIKKICHAPGWDPAAERERKVQAYATTQRLLAQVYDLMDAGRMDEAREMFNAR